MTQDINIDLEIVELGDVSELTEGLIDAQPNETVFPARDDS